MDVVSLPILAIAGGIIVVLAVVVLVVIDRRPD
jgi:hypothetical protein